MEMMNVIIGILCLIGLIVVIAWLSSIYSRKVKKNSKDLAESWPPLKYMNVVGSKCPDYWQFVGTKTVQVPGKPPIIQNICKNTFNIPAGADPDNPYNCYGDGKDEPLNTHLFDSNETQWPIVNKNLNNTETCRWIRNCGPIKDSNAAWLGFSDKC